MNLECDKIKLSKLILEQVDHTTCLQCCKSYIAPATALCGHSLCHTCWRGHRTCPTCSKPLDRKALKLNLPLQTLTGHIQALTGTFEKLFSMKLDEFVLESPGEFQSEKDKDKNVKDWLANSENQFSAPLSQESVQDILKPPNPLEISASNIQVHTHTKKSTSPSKVVHAPPPPQDDWDKIEPMPDTEVNLKNKENIVGPMDIEPFYIDDNEYTSENPRRSSRKRELNSDVSGPKSNLSNKLSSKDSGLENEKKSEKAKQTWHNVKKMRKEFSKLNKQNRNKLNVSIEMVKKTQTLKPANNLPAEVEQIYNIDDKTPIANRDHDIDENNIVNNNDGKSLQKAISDDVIEINEIATEDHVANYLQNYNAVVQKETDNEIETTVSPKQIPVAITPAPQSDDINNETVPTKMPFVKKGTLLPKNDEISIKVQDQSDERHNDAPATNTDDIEITIKIGTTITNIVIKKKENDVQVKVHTDRGIQTSLGDNGLVKEQFKHNDTVIDENINEIKKCDTIKNTPSINMSLKSHDQSNKNLNKTTSVKKNTASAETATAQFEITESVEKELSNIMECEESIGPQHSVSHSLKKNTPVTKKTLSEKASANDKKLDEVCIEEDINDLDIFGSGSVKEANVKLLSNPAPSEILISTVQNKFRTQKLAEKRDREGNSDDNMPSSKKLKTTQKEKRVENNLGPDSEPINYDAVMDQVFANIDADIEDIRQSQRNLNDKESNTNKSETIIAKTQSKGNKQDVITLSKPNESLLQKHSENVFSMIEKEDEQLEVNKDAQVPQQVEELLTPVLCGNFNTLKDTEDLNKTSKSRRKSLHDCDDSDRSVVEETPQKDISFSKLKRASTTNRNLEHSQENLTETKMIPLKSATENVKSIINITDTLADNSRTNDVTIIDVARKHTLETPLTITKFADQIKHKSTPVARKSLHFDNENLDDNDPEQTLCPSSVIAKTTQEKEFLFNAFEKTPTRVTRPLATKNSKKLDLGNRRFCLAGSCLSASDITKLKYLCSERNWTYVEKYTNDITHLVVGVDEENKSQRSVKYMCALAASKWIVSFEWVKRCLVTKTVVDETPYEALDSTGEAGPRRSRTAKQKLFEGITFYCMPPFSVLDVDTLKSMLTAAGGRVASELKQVRVSGESGAPALLLAEPEHTQEDRFIYLTMELQVVPVNFEWVLNCLGSYMLGSVQELLLCPSALLPPATAKWPEVLLAQEYD